MNQLPGSTGRQSTAAHHCPCFPQLLFLMHHGKGNWCKLKILISTTIAMNLITGNNEHLLSTKYFPDTELIALLISSHLILSTIFWQRDYCLHFVDVETETWMVMKFSHSHGLSGCQEELKTRETLIPETLTHLHWWGRRSSIFQAHESSCRHHHPGLNFLCDSALYYVAWLRCERFVAIAWCMRCHL